jgi:hypothetical protein
MIEIFHPDHPSPRSKRIPLTDILVANDFSPFSSEAIVLLLRRALRLVCRVFFVAQSISRMVLRAKSFMFYVDPTLFPHDIRRVVVVPLSVSVLDRDPWGLLRGCKRARVLSVGVSGERDEGGGVGRDEGKEVGE